LAHDKRGDLLIRALGWRPHDVAAQLDDLTTIVGPPLVMTGPWLRQAATLAHPSRSRDDRASTRRAI
jgi:hypothetical protein